MAAVPNEPDTKIELLRLMTCGNVDDGKSTLIGRLLWESQDLMDDQVDALIKDSQRYGTQGSNIDFALLVDGLSAEREQGITIDVAYRFFATPRRRFILADTPGHEQYTRNMVTAATTADVAVLLIDARKGILTQTRRHAYLASLVGVRHVVVAINKMDCVGYSADIYAKLVKAASELLSSLGFASVEFIPLSALHGDNMLVPSANMPWYSGPTLLPYLEAIRITRRNDQGQLVFPVQWINRPNEIFRGICGTIAEGTVHIGDNLRNNASGEISRVEEIITMDGSLTRAEQGKAVTIRLDRDIDISRGDVLSHEHNPLETSDSFEVTLVWMHQDPAILGRTYQLKLSTQTATASITGIAGQIDINTLSQKPSDRLGLNDIVICTIAINHPLVFSEYATSKALGCFILIDRFSNATVAAGMIARNLRRSQNVHRQALAVKRPDREKLNGHAGKVIWFTGLSGSGKTTIANALELELHRLGKKTYILDGDNMRQGLNKDLGFTDVDRGENIRRVAEVAKLMLDAGLIVLTAFISPFASERALAKDVIGRDDFIEVHINTSLTVCERRDPKGLYKKARDGLIMNMTGIDSPYEPPEEPDLRIDGSGDIRPAVRDMLRLIL